MKKRLQLRLEVDLEFICLAAETIIDHSQTASSTFQAQLLQQPAERIM